LNPINFLAFKVRLAALGADASRNCVPVNVIALAIDAIGCSRLCHSPFAIKALHVYNLLVESGDHVPDRGGKQ